MLEQIDLDRTVAKSTYDRRLHGVPEVLDAHLQEGAVEAPEGAAEGSADGVAGHRRGPGPAPRVRPFAAGRRGDAGPDRHRRRALGDRGGDRQTVRPPEGP